MKTTITTAALLATLTATAQEVQHFKLTSLPAKPVNELLTRGMISGEQGTIGYFTYRKGAVVPTHQHSNEQYSLITQGSVSVLINDKEYIVKAGEGIIIPPNTPHSFTALEDGTIDIDFFTPARKDWLQGTDNYYQQKSVVSSNASAWGGKPLQPEVFAGVDNAVGNIAFTAKGDLVYSQHPFFNPEIRVMQYDAATKTSSPFPNKAWNTPRATDDYYLSNVLGIRNDENGIVWILDMAQRNAITPKIVGWNTHTNQLEKIYCLPLPATNKFSQPNDMVVDTKHGFFIIADEGIGNDGDGSTAALIVVDMKTGKTRRLLEGHRTTLPEHVPTIIKGDTLAVGGKPLLVGADGITADKDFEWLYYAPLNGSKIYRVRIADLLDENITASALDKKIETYSAKPNNGGLSIDAAGNLYLTALETNSVAIVLAKDRSVNTMVQHQDLLWPDGISYNTADGYMYVSAAQVHLGAAFHNGKNLSKAPFYIFRFKPIAEGVPYR